jgi:hypothetical protein
LAGNRFDDLHAQDFIAAHDLIDRLHVRFVHATENRVAAVEMRLSNFFKAFTRISEQK